MLTNRKLRYVYEVNMLVNCACYSLLLLRWLYSWKGLSKLFKGEILRRLMKKYFWPGLLLSIYPPTYLFIYLTFFKTYPNFVALGTWHCRQVVLAIFLGLMSCFLYKNRTQVLTLMAVGLQAHREDCGYV